MEAGVMQEVRMALIGSSDQDKVHATYTTWSCSKAVSDRQAGKWVENQFKIQEDK